LINMDDWGGTTADVRSDGLQDSSCTFPGFRR
jgi:hypothetical protein